MSTRYLIDRGSEHVIGLEPRSLKHRSLKGMSKQLKARIANQNPRDHKRFCINIPTPDEWNPTLEDGTVEASVRILKDVDGNPDSTTWVRTCVWGGDDTGMERDEPFQNTSDAEDCYQRRVKQLQSWGIVTFKMLKFLGFKMA